MTPGGGLTREVKAIAIVVIAGAIMSILNATIVNVALESLRHDLGMSLADAQWVTTGYLLALAAVIPLTGYMAERFSPRRVWLVVVAAFAAGSVLCGLAWDGGSLIAFRVVQGLAGGMIMPVGTIMLAQAAGPANMGRVMGIIGVPMLLAPVLGPVLGGFIVEHLSWRWIFFVDPPVALIALALGRRLLPHGRAVGRGGADAAPVLDKRGLVLLPAGVAILVFGLSEVGIERTLAAPTAWVPIVVGALLIGAFLVHARRFEHPLVDVALFRGRGFSAAAATTFLLGIALFGSMLLLPLYYQIVRGASPLEAGLLLAPQGVGAAIGMSIGGRLTDRLGAGRVVLGGLLVLCLGTVVFAFIGPDTSYWALSAGLVLRGLGLGASMMPAMAGAYATLRRDQVPRATPMLNVVQRVGGSLGTAVLIVILQNGIVSAVGPTAAEAGAAAATDADARAVVAGPLADAFSTAYTWALVLTALAFIPALLLAREERRARRAAAVDGARGEQPPVSETPVAA